MGQVGEHDVAAQLVDEPIPVDRALALVNDAQPPRFLGVARHVVRLPLEHGGDGAHVELHPADGSGGEHVARRVE